MTRDFPGSLRTQLGFIERSLQDFLNGFEDEAYRIATALRVIFHNTPASTSLLAHLNQLSTPVLTTFPTSNQVMPAPQIHIPQVVVFENGKAPTFDIFPYRKAIPAPEWWAQNVIGIQGNWITRKQIVLWLANKDGGAHVDANLPPDYVRLMGDGKIVLTNPGKVVEIPVKQPFLLARQFAYEVLESPGIKSLTT